MKEDKLKDFIHAHRDEFDDAKPSKHVWASIEQELTRPVTKPIPTGKVIIFKMLKIAAGVALLLMAGGGAGVYMQQKKYGEAITIQNKDERNEYLEAQTYFTSQIDEKLDKLSQLNTDQSVIDELNQIDQVSAELKMELLKNPDQDKDLLIKQMMRQYQQKLNLLNKILNKLEENKSTNDSLQSKKMKQNEKDSIQL